MKSCVRRHRTINSAVHPKPRGAQALTDGGPAPISRSAYRDGRPEPDDPPLAIPFSKSGIWHASQMPALCEVIQPNGECRV